MQLTSQDMIRFGKQIIVACPFGSDEGANTTV